jgi:hypothetical protein
VIVQSHAEGYGKQRTLYGCSRLAHGMRQYPGKLSLHN